VEVVKKEVREAMEGSITLRVPLSVDIGVGKNWLESK
jgi:DNA polymerase I-like protein with 3'-5' exonuclease and polymerase domains